MAFCLMVVFGYMRKTQRKRIKLYTKLGGKFVGYLKLPDKSLSLWEQVVDLRKQAAKLWPPSTNQSFLDVLLYVDNTLITKSNTELVDIFQNGALHMMWDAYYTRSMEVVFNYFPTLFYRS